MGCFSTTSDFTDIAVTDSTAATVTRAARRGCIIPGTGWAFRTPDITPALTMLVLVAAVTPPAVRIMRVTPDFPAAAVRRRLIGVFPTAPREAGLNQVILRATMLQLRRAIPAARRAAVDPPATAGPRRLRIRALRAVITPRQNRPATGTAAETPDTLDTPDTLVDMVTPAAVDTRTAAARTRSSCLKAW